MTDEKERQENLEALAHMRDRGMFGAPNENGCQIMESSLMDMFKPKETPPQPATCDKGKKNKR